MLTTLTDDGATVGARAVSIESSRVLKHLLRHVLRHVLRQVLKQVPRQVLRQELRQELRHVDDFTATAVRALCSPCRRCGV